MIAGMPLSAILSRLIYFYELLIFVYVVLSWFPTGGGIVADIRRVLASLCEPYIGLFRRILPRGAGGGIGLDFSPMVAILVLVVVGNFVVALLQGAGL